MEASSAPIRDTSSLLKMNGKYLPLKLFKSRKLHLRRRLEILRSEKAYAFEGDEILVIIPFNFIHQVDDKSSYRKHAPPA